MKRTLAGAVALAVAVCATSATAAAATAPSSHQTAQHQTAQQQASGSQRFVVRRDTTVGEARFAAALRGAGLTLVRSQPALDLAVVSGPAGAQDTLRALPGVSRVAPDYTVQPQSLGFDYTTQPGSMTNVTNWTSAQAMWRAGYTGAGVDVALIDTGISPVPALSASDKVVVGPDLSFESQTPAARYLDSYGHGTAMAGIIAGREVPRASGTTYANDTSNYYGIAPDARLISLKMADHSGAVDVSQMIAAIDWVVSYHNSGVGNIRVINLSYGAKSGLNAQDDPLSWAAEVAWNAGIVVVVSTGNDAQSSLGLASPAFNPWVLAVGAEDPKNTSTVADDVVAPFSNIGDGRSRHPDLLAPGVGMISPAVPGSYLATTYPKALMGNGFIRGSGTSQAAAVVSGAVALLLQKYPTLTPDEVKRTLMRTAGTIPNLPSAIQGKGRISLNKMLTEAPSWGFVQPELKGNGKGSLEGARGGVHVTINGQQVTGENDIMGRSWDSAVMAYHADVHAAWSGDGSFNWGAWIGANGMIPDTTSWAGKTWQGRTWQSRAWEGNNWVGKTWQSGTWSGNTWSSASWTGPVATAGWASAAWSSSNWG